MKGNGGSPAKSTDPRARGRRQGRGVPLGVVRDGLAVFCWCQCDVVMVAASDVRKGLTGPCLWDDCQEIDRLMRRN